jgi:Co/Zn/Cd efflux system component
MARSSRYWINVAICVLVLVHAIYRFMSRPEVASDLWMGLVVAQGVLGAFGIVWFWIRARGASA